MTFSAQPKQPLYLNPSVDWPDHHLLRRIFVWPCGCQTALYADDVRYWTLDRTLWSCDIHGIAKETDHAIRCHSNKILPKRQ